MPNRNFVNSLPAFTWHFLKEYKIWIVALFICAATLGCWGPINAFLIKNIINSLTESSNANLEQKIFAPCLFLLLNLLVHDITWRFWSLINYKVQPKIKSKITHFTYKYIFQQSCTFFQSNYVYRITENINSLGKAIENVASHTSMYMVRCFTTLIVALTAMYFIHPLLFLGLLVWNAAYIAISYKSYKKGMPLADQYAESETQISNMIVDGITNSQSIKKFAQFDYESNCLEHRLKHMRQTWKSKALFTIKTHFLQRLSLTMALCYMLYILTYLKTFEIITIGDYALTLIMTIDVSWSLWWSTEQIEYLADTMRTCNHSLKQLFMPLDVQDKPSAVNLKIFSGKIQISNINFMHKSSSFAINCRHLIIPAGQKVGLVGHPGSGKTTFVKLIMRLYEVETGSIKIDNQDVRDVFQTSLHKSIAYLSQEPSLFNRTIMENIRYGNNSASEFEVILAAKKAHAHEFIEKLPRKYNTIIGEGGIRLNSSQKQRLAIARAMLKNAPILIIDEATSQLDPLLEQEVEDSLWQFMQRKTTIVISHRPSTLQLMDRILVMEDGKIVEDGTHEQLLFKGDGLYNTLWNTEVCGIFNDL